MVKITLILLLWIGVLFSAEYSASEVAFLKTKGAKSHSSVDFEKNTFELEVIASNLQEAKIKSASDEVGGNIDVKPILSTVLFTKTYSMNRAAPKINTLQPREVFTYLLKK